MIAPGARGSALAWRQPDRVTYDPVRGVTRYAVWECIDDVTVDLLAQQYLALQLCYTITSSGTKHRLEIEIPGGSTDPLAQIQPQDNWQMPGNEIQKSQWEHKKAVLFDPDLVAFAVKNIDAGTKFADFITAAQADPTLALLLPTDTTDLKRAYNLVQRGSTHFATGQYVLKHSTNVGHNYQANVADLNVGMLYTPDQLISEITNPQLWVLPCPPRLIFKIRNLAAPDPHPDYLWSWRKLQSTEATAAGGRIEIATEYWLEQWSLFDYDPVV